MYSTFPSLGSCVEVTSILRALPLFAKRQVCGYALTHDAPSPAVPQLYHPAKHHRPLTSFGISFYVPLELTMANSERNGPLSSGESIYDTECPIPGP